MAKQPPAGPKWAEEPPAAQPELDDHLSCARIMVAKYWPYLAPAMNRVVPRWLGDGTGLSTLAVDRYWRLYLNRRFVTWVCRTQGIAAFALLLVGHELQHLLLGHMIRLRGWRDIYLVDKATGDKIELVNLANDLEINDRLAEFVTAAQATASDRPGSRPPPPFALPDYGNYSRDFKTPDGKAFPEKELSETYAELLLSLAKHNGPAGGSGGQRPAKDGAGSVSTRGQCRCGTGAGGSEESAPWEDKAPPQLGDSTTGVHPDEEDVIRQQTAKEIQEHVRKNRGTVPGYLDQWAQVRLAPPKVPWQEELRRAARDMIDEVAGRHQTTYRRPNRRSAGSQVLLPGYVSYMPSVVCCFDTSGSMSASDYDASFSEIQGVIRAKGAAGRGVPCMAVDAAAYVVQWVRDVGQLKMSGGGGTDMMAGIHAAVRSKLRASLVIVFTDGYTGWDAENPYPGLSVLAVLTNRSAPTPPDWIRTVYACD